MKNKLLFLILILTTNFSFINSAVCQPLIEGTCCPEIYTDSSFQDFNCEVSDQYRYISFGVGPVIFIPNIGIGYRERHSQFGWDTALSFSTIGYAHQFGAHLVGHYYLSPSQQNSAYLGLGLMGSGMFTNQCKHGCVGTLSPDFVFGKELERRGNSRHFIEMHVAIPTMLIKSKDHHSLYLPLMYVKYGISF